MGEVPLYTCIARETRAVFPRSSPCAGMSSEGARFAPRLAAALSLGERDEADVPKPPVCGGLFPSPPCPKPPPARGFRSKVHDSHLASLCHCPRPIPNQCRAKRSPHPQALSIHSTASGDDSSLDSESSQSLGLSPSAVDWLDSGWGCADEAPAAVERSVIPKCCRANRRINDSQDQNLVLAFWETTLDLQWLQLKLKSYNRNRF